MLLVKQLGKCRPILLVAIGLALAGFPLVVSRAIDSHNPAQKYYGVSFFEFFDHFIVFPLPVTYSLSAPDPSTQYPFLAARFLPPASLQEAAAAPLLSATCLSSTPRKDCRCGVQAHLRHLPNISLPTLTPVCNLLHTPVRFPATTCAPPYAAGYTSAFPPCSSSCAPSLSFP